MTPVIEAVDLTKRYGASRGVEELTFEVAKGEVFGYLGPNGAGKTTTIRTFLDFIRPTSGTVRVFGLDPRSDGVQVHARVGYLPGELALYPRLRGERYLRTFASLRDGSGWPFAEQLADRLQLDLDRPIKELSHGNKQKVGLVQAFMHRPDLLVLDEPTQGLDPLMQQTFYAMLDDADVGAVILDRVGNAVYMNEAARTLLGAPTGRLPAWTDHYIDSILASVAHTGYAAERWELGQLLLRVEARPLDARRAVLQVTVARSLSDGSRPPRSPARPRSVCPSSSRCPLFSSPSSSPRPPDRCCGRHASIPLPR